MGLHLASGALNQAALARDRARGRPSAAGCWPRSLFVVWMLTPLVAEQLLRTEIGYAGATALLAAALACSTAAAAGSPALRRAPPPGSSRGDRLSDPR